MNKEYLINTCLQASIHTTTVRCRDMDNIPPHIDKEIVKASYLQRSDVWSMLINPNKICGDLFSYSDFRAVMNTLFAELEVKDPTYYRTDIRIDSYADTFKQFYKVNMIIIMLFAMRYQKNNGMAMGQICLQSKDYCDISYSNDYFEMKYYDKRFQTHDQDPAKARFEIRCLKTMRANGLPPHEFANIISDWFKELPSRYEELQQICNEFLYEEYTRHCEFCGGVERKRDYLTEFLSSYHNTLTIFTRHQLIKFLIMCGVDEKKAGDRANYIAQKTHIEFFSKADIVRYIEQLKTTISAFFES